MRQRCPRRVWSHGRTTDGTSSLTRRHQSDASVGQLNVSVSGDDAQYALLRAPGRRMGVFIFSWVLAYVFESLKWGQGSDGMNGFAVLRRPVVLVVFSSLQGVRTAGVSRGVTNATSCRASIHSLRSRT